jgi:serine/threonine-protein kinase
MSPEQATGGSKPVDRRTDVFAVGVMLWEALTQKPFWAGRDSLTILHALVEGEYDPSPRAVDPSIDAEHDQVCRTALAHDAEHRYPTALAFREALERLLDRVGPRVENPNLGEHVARMFEFERQTTREAIESALAELRGEVVPKPSPKAPPTQPRGDAGAARDATPSALDGPRAASSRHGRLGAGLAVLGLAAIAAGVGIASRNASEPASQVSFRVSVVPDHARLQVGDDAWTTNPYAGEAARRDAETTIRAEAEGFEPRTVRVRLDRDRSVRVVLRKKGAHP